MQTLRVELDSRSYSIHIGQGLLSQPELLLPAIKRKKVAIVTNTTVAPLYLSRLQEGLHRAGIFSTVCVLADGEQFKDWTSLNQIFNTLLENHCERSTTLIALGGGVIGDMGGFAAACYQRGMPFVQVPTTLLSQVDSSVGGKTAINHPLGKNMIGTFYQPKLVLADTETLNTLPDRELSAGLAEVIKYGLIRDLPFLEWLESNLERILAREPQALAYAIEHSCANKAEVVAVDEREEGERAHLNLGHTFGHALEAGLGYGVWLHGEAVAAGTMMAMELSAAFGYLNAADIDRVDRLFRRARLPCEGAGMAPERYLELMRHDKKVDDGRLRLILLSSIGKAFVSNTATDAQITAAITARLPRA